MQSGLSRCKRVYTSPALTWVRIVVECDSDNSSGTTRREKGRTVPTNYLQSFGKLLKRLRGDTSFETLAERAGLDPIYLENVEAGRTPADAAVALQVFRKGFGLSRSDAQRLLLGVQLYDLGLKNNDLRQLVVDLILGTTPPGVRTKLRALYRAYAA